MTEKQIFDYDTTGAGCHGVYVYGPYNISSQIRGADGEFIEERIRKTLEVGKKMITSPSQGGKSSRSPSAPNHGGDFDKVGAVMSIDETLVCSFKVLKPAKDKR